MRALGLMALLFGVLGCDDKGDDGGGGGFGGGGFGGSGGFETGGDNRETCFLEEPTGDRPSFIDSCGERDLCVDGFCEPAFGRRYNAVVLAAFFAERDAAGDCWDAACGAPDPFVNVYVDGDFVGGTPTRQDTYEAEWDESTAIVGEATVNLGSSARVEVADEDLSANDIVLRCDFDLSADRLRERLVVCGNDSDTVAVVVGFGAVR